MFLIIIKKYVFFVCSDLCVFGSLWSIRILIILCIYLGMISDFDNLVFVVVCRWLSSSWVEFRFVLCLLVD